MPLNPASLSLNTLLEIDGQIAGILTSADIGAIRAAPVTASLSAAAVRSAVVRAEFDECTIVTPLAESQSHLAWLAGLWGRQAVEKSGAIIVADYNFKERRRATFGNAVVTSLTLDDLDTTNVKEPYRLTYRMAPERLSLDLGSGADMARNLGKKAKPITAGNFRIRIGGLPCDRVTRVSGLSLRSEQPLETFGSTSGPRGVPRCGDITVEIADDDRTLSEWTRFATRTLQDGVTSETEEVDCTIEWLDQTLKSTVATLTLQGCALKAFKWGSPSERTSGPAERCTAVFAVEQFAPEGIVLKSN